MNIGKENFDPLPSFEETKNYFEGPKTEIIYWEMYNPSPIPSLLLLVHYPNVLYSPPNFYIISFVIPEPVSLTSKNTKFS